MSGITPRKWAGCTIYKEITLGSNYGEGSRLAHLGSAGWRLADGSGRTENAETLFGGSSGDSETLGSKLKLAQTLTWPKGVASKLCIVIMIIWFKEDFILFKA